MASVAEKPDGEKGPPSEVRGEERAAAGGGVDDDMGLVSSAWSRRGGGGGGAAEGRVGVATGRGERDDRRGDRGCCGRSGEMKLAMEKWRA